MSASRIVWLASYPKSGNTWLRLILGHLMLVGERTKYFAQTTPYDWSSALHGGWGRGNAASRSLFDTFSGIAAGDLPDDEIFRLRPRVYEAMARAESGVIYLKTHDAYLETPDGEPMHSEKATWATVYIVRNPLDVAVSFAHFAFRGNCDQAIAAMADPGMSLSSDSIRQNVNLRQPLLSWSNHVSSWLDAQLVRCQLLRYEDLLLQPLGSVREVANFLGLDCSDAAIATAVEATRFERLRDFEDEFGFEECPAAAERFFREGCAGTWRRSLNHAQVARILRDHGPAMRRVGYVSATGGIE